MIWLLTVHRDHQILYYPGPYTNTQHTYTTILNSNRLRYCPSSIYWRPHKLPQPTNICQVNVDFFGPKQSSLCTGFCCNPHASIRFNPLWVQTLNASHAIHQKPRGETEGSVVHHHAHRKGAGIHKVLRRNRYLGGVAMGSSMWTSKLAPECHHPLLGPLGVSHQIKKNARMSHGFHLSTAFEVVKSLTSHQGLHDKIS